MYRSYEDPAKLERLLDMVLQERDEMVARGADEMEILSIDESIWDIKERINLAMFNNERREHK